MMQPAFQRVAVYARVSTNDQHAENQLLELRTYCGARGWTITAEYIDQGISGSTTRRPQLDAMMQAAKRRKFDAIICWKLDRLGRSLSHLVTLLEDITTVGIGFVSLGESIDLSTSAGRLQMHLLSAFAEFERDRIRERIHLGLDRARKQGKKLGRRARAEGEPLTVRQAAALWGCSKSQAARRLSRGEVPPAPASAAA
jgi:putative DNA-invertase from lambdoid prophage Rac